MDPADIALRNATYRRFVELGRAPSARELAELEGLSEPDVQAGWRRLHEAHALVLDPDSNEIRMANPFSARPTAFRVEAAGRTWFANCAWDAFGIGAALHVDSTIRAECPDCRSTIDIAVKDGVPRETGLLFHVLVPAVSWWDDIGFT